MDIEIIRNQSDDFSFRIVFGNENFHELCKILHCSPFGYLSHPFSCFEFYRHEYICCSIPDIVVIIFFWTSRFHWNGFPLISKKLFWFLVKAYERFLRVIFFFIEVENVVHSFSIFGIYRLNTPHPSCLLYTSDAADEEDSVDLGGRRIIKKKK